MSTIMLSVAAVIACRAAVEPDRSRFLGDYEGGCDHEGTLVLKLRADGGFLYDEACEVAARYEGRWSIREDLVELEPEVDAATESYPKLPVRWRLVPWGERRYLIPDGQIIRLCNAINLGEEPRDRPQGWALLRRGDASRRVTGDPELPEAWRAFLLKQPIDGRIIAFEEGGFARLDVGGNDGLLAGMMLHAHVEGQARCARLKIVCPCDDSARADIVRGGACADDGAEYADLVINDAVSTSAREFLREVPTRGGAGVTLVPEGRSLPLKLGGAEVAPPDVATAFHAAWEKEREAVADVLTAEVLSRISRRFETPSTKPHLDRERFGRLRFEPIGRDSDSGGWVFAHPTEAGIPMPKVRAVRRALCFSAVFDPVQGRTVRVFVTIGAWIEE
ncbi:MAG: hypothetical protein KJ057_01660 [Phycisphaerae bacterium]|nr:MAG: hypothetical protein EDS66_06205 [Planctomycetota bacterium]KAB2945856.1 MAG: hypothetical protein F9K17_09350 [Phycisphaerae bacterium]MBE7455903.1 hypothetical protein [Planctomycetia bacterium]MCK6465244.1 hypothetical protein [Phycisphaerae bacterium]MCL4717161.1 hypothetical protein [Phycisphaerae bacterium]